MTKLICILLSVIILGITGCGQQSDEKLEVSNIQETNVEETNIEETNIEETNIEETNIEETNVEETNVEETNVEETNIQESNVQETNVQASVTDEPSVLTTENSQIVDDVKLTTSENAILPDTYDTENISLEEYESFTATTDANDAEGYNKFDDFADVLKQDFIGTWYDPEMGEAIRLTNEGAYVYIPYLDEYGDTLYEWELIDRSDRNLCPELAIYILGKEAGPLAYYVAGFREDYFWCNSQMQIFYRQ